MAKLFYFIVFWSVAQFASAQCKSGDCNNGQGEYDFGWCRYKGEFKDGKPAGTGTMTYDDYTYTGQFSNGVEDGQGVITYKDGRTENVLYSKGTKQAAGPDKVAPGQWKELKGTDPGCKNGNCETGVGTYEFPSGNKYIGSFVNEKRQGQGKFMFANGDVVEGNFYDNSIIEGTYTFNNGCRFTGKWNDKGDMYNGVWYSPTGIAAKLVNGTVIPPEPQMILPRNLPPGTIIIDGNAVQEPVCENWVTCPHCGGRKIISKPIVTKYSYTVGGSYSIDQYGNRHTDYPGVTNEHTSTIPNYEVCNECGGKGKICGK